jgi:hypothetical protein
MPVDEFTEFSLSSRQDCCVEASVGTINHWGPSTALCVFQLTQGQLIEKEALGVSNGNAKK